MRNYLLKFCLILLFFKSIDLLSQQKQLVPYPTPQINCRASERDLFLRNNDPQYVINRQQIEEFIEQFSRNPIQEKSTYTIPVVVHVIHLGEAVGTGTNISDAQIQSAIDNLNDAYSNTSTAFTAYTGLNTDIQFCLAQRDPSGNPTTGIVRVSGTGVTQYSSKGICDSGGGTGTDNEVAVKALSKWDNTKYYNFWIVSEINDNNGGPGTQGYAYYPGAGPSLDGAVMLYNAFGYDPDGSLAYNLKNYTNRNVTAIHEVGHALNLYHTFEGDGTGSTCPTGNQCGSGVGDCCADTPPHKRSTSGCVADGTSNTCSAGTTAGDHQHNFMDYSSDDCQTEFTANQITRLQATLSGTRASLNTSNGCVPANNNYDASITGIIAPISSYCQTTFSPQVTLRNFGLLTLTSVTITYNIDGGANQTFNWTGSLATGVSETVTLNPVTTSVGAHTFSATTSSPNGQADEFTTNDNSSIAFTITTSSSLPFTEDFEGAFPPANWTKTSGDVANGTAWDVDGIKDLEKRAVTSESDGTAGNAMALNGFAYSTSNGTRFDEMTSPSINLSGASTPTLQFQVSHKYFNTTSNTEALKVYISTDCGVNYTTIYDKSAAALATNGQGGTSWAPTLSTHWRQESIDLTAYAGSVVTLKFETFSNYGNNLYIDKINLFDNCTSPAITSQPGNASVCSGANTSFTVANTGGGTYQWQENNGGGFVNITNGGVYSNATTATLNLTGLITGMNGYTYRCVITNGCGNTTSNSATLTVNASVTPSVSIASNDADNAICSGTSVTFTATPTNGGAGPSYQWKLNGTNVGSNAATYTNAALANGDAVTCVITSNATCASPTTATSNSISTTVTTSVTPSVSIASNDADNTICSGTSVTFTATPTNGGAGPSYQWKLNGANVGSNATTYTNATLTNGDVVTCVMTSNAACASPATATSSAITMTVNSNVTPSISITSSDADNTICTGTSVTFTATPTNGGSAPSYQWKLNGVNVGSNSSTYTNAGLSNGDAVTCVLTSNASCLTVATATSNSIATSVNTSVAPTISIVSDDADNSICSATSVTFTATPTNGGSSPSYQWKLNGGNVGSNSASYTNASLANGDAITCVLTSNDACASPATASANTINMTVSASVTPSISIVSDDADNLICSGTSVTFTATPTNGGATPGYQWKLNGTNVGGNSTTYTNAGLANGDIVTCVLTSNAACASPSSVTSNNVTMTVNANVSPAVSIASNDADNSICAGTSVTFTATPINGGSSPSYQWKINGTNVATGSSFSSLTLNNNDQITCDLTNSDQCASPSTATSNTITFTVNANVSPSISISSDDADNSICTGTTVNFSSSITNGGASPTYDWKLNGVSVGSGSTYSNSTLSDLDVITCDLTSNASCLSTPSASSNTITMSVSNSLTPSITIVSDDSDNTICPGSNVTFTASATNGGSSPTFDWKLNGASVGSGSTYSNSALTDLDVIICDMISNDACASPTNASSNVITISVTNSLTPSITIVSDDADNTICSGTSVTFNATINNGGAAPAYQWKLNGGNLAGETGSSLVLSSLANGDVVSCELVSNDPCANPTTVQSNDLAITVTGALIPSVSITSDDADNTICAGTAVSFTATPVNGGSAPSYIWKVNGSDVGTGATFSSSTLNNNDVVLAVMTSNDLCASPATATSGAITMTVTATLTPSLVISSDDADNTICSGTAVTFSATPTNGGSSPSFDWKLNGVSVGSGTSFTSSTLVDQDVITCDLISNDACANPTTASSNSIAITVVNNLAPSIVISSDDADNSICNGTSVTFTAVVTNGGSSPAYQWNLNGTAIPGETNSSYTSSSLADADVISCDLVSNDPCANPTNASSNTITITVGTISTPSVSILSDDADNSICNLSSITFTATAVNAGASPSYQWNVNGSPVPGETASTFISSSIANNDQITCDIMSSDLCSTPAGASSNSIAITVNNTPSISIGVITNTTACGNTDGSFQILGSGAGTISWTGTTSGSQPVNLPVTLPNFGSGTFNFVFDDGCPSNTVSGSIVDPGAPATPTVVANGPTTFCDGGSVTLTSSVSSNITWSTGETSQSIVVTASGNYFVTNSISGCSSSSAATSVTVNPNPVAAVISSLGSTTFCTGGSVVLTSSLSSGNLWSTGASSQSITVSTSGSYSVTTTLGSCSATSNVIPVVVNSTTNIVLGGVTGTSSCGGSDGQIEILGSGTGTVSWTGTSTGSQNVILPIILQNFAAGSYDLTFNNGCNSNTLSTSVSDPGLPTAPTITAQGATTFCEGGNVILSSSQSSGNVWSTGATSQSITVTASGTYSTTVSSAPGCSASSNSITVTVNPIPAAPSISADGATTFCQGGSVNLTSSASSGNLWTGGASTQTINVTASGSYTVNVTQNGCTSPNSAPVTITVNPIPLMPSISADGPISFCQGEDVVLTSDITTGILWSNGSTSASITVSTAGTFTVTNTVNGCSTISDPVTTVVNTTPTPSITSIPDICDTAATFALNQASPAGGTYTVDGTVATSFTPGSGNIGSHTVVYTLTQNNCTGSTNTTFNVINCSGVGLEENTLELQLFPNPSSGMIEVKGLDKNEIESISVYDNVGKLILTVKNDNQVNLSPFSNGMYNLVIKTNTFESQQKVQLVK